MRTKNVRATSGNKATYIVEQSFSIEGVGHYDFVVFVDDTLRKQFPKMTDEELAAKVVETGGHALDPYKEDAEESLADPEFDTLDYFDFEVSDVRRG